jgi:hypothetical protein
VWSTCSRRWQPLRRSSDAAGEAYRTLGAVVAWRTTGQAQTAVAAGIDAGAGAAEEEGRLRAKAALSSRLCLRQHSAARSYLLQGQRLKPGSPPKLVATPVRFHQRWPQQAPSRQLS